MEKLSMTSAIVIVLGSLHQPAAMDCAQVAPQGKPFSAAVVNSEKVITDSKMGKDGLSELKRLQEAKEEALKGQKDKIKQLQKETDEGRLTLPQAKLAALAREIDENQSGLRRAEDNANRELSAKRDQALARLESKVIPIIDELAKERGFTMVFRKYESGLLFVDESVDITAEVIRRLDASPK